MKRIVRLSDENFNAFADALHISRQSAQVQIPGGSYLVVMREDKEQTELMTREEAIKVIANRSFLDSLAALGLIKFREETYRGSDEQIIANAEFRFCREIVEFDNKQPLNTVTDMAKTIRQLLKIIRNK